MRSKEAIEAIGDRSWFFDKVVRVHLCNEKHLIAGLCAEERDKLFDKFRLWMHSFGPSSEGEGE
jgi:hypothetical protein